MDRRWIPWTVAAIVSAIPAAASNPQTWPVVFQEVYDLAPREGTQLPLEPEGMRVRRFHLRVESDLPIEVELTRAYDSSTLCSERRTREVAVTIPWGRDESGELSLFNEMRPDGQRNSAKRARVLVSIAVDPATRDEPVHSFSVNRFLEDFEAGATAHLVAHLQNALAQDAADSLARQLLDRITGADGYAPDVAEARAVQRIAEGLDALRRAGDLAGVDALLADPPALTTPEGILRWNLLVGAEHMRRRESVLALQAFQRAYDAAPDGAARMQVYPHLIAANRAIGNDPQADAILERALAEAPDAATRALVESWRAQAP